MSYEEVLLIGGHKDGERISVMRGMPSIRFAAMPDAQGYVGSSAYKGEKNLDEVVYRRAEMSGDQGFRGCVYVIDGVDPMAALIDGYRKP